LSIEFIILASLLVTLVFLAVYLIVRYMRLSANYQLLHSQVTANEMLFSDIQVNLSTQQNEINLVKDTTDAAHIENDQVTKQLEHRIKKLQEHILQLEERINQILEQQPQDKFYSRAIKLAEKGADVDEIMSECELPRAEAEMLIALRKQNK